jgi:hypothetical protein
MRFRQMPSNESFKPNSNRYAITVGLIPVLVGTCTSVLLELAKGAHALLVASVASQRPSPLPFGFQFLARLPAVTGGLCAAAGRLSPADGTLASKKDGSCAFGRCRLTSHSSRTRFAGRLNSGVRGLNETKPCPFDIDAFGLCSSNRERC